MYQLFPLGSQGWLQTAVHCHYPESRVQAAYHWLEKIYSKFEVKFLLNAYQFHTIKNLKWICCKLLLLLLLSHFSRVRLLATPWTAAYQAPLSMGFTRQKYLEWVAIAFSHVVSWGHTKCGEKRGGMHRKESDTSLSIVLTCGSMLLSYIFK